MLSSLVGWTLRFPRLVVAAAIVLLVYGGVVLSRSKLDVFPEFVPAQAEVQTEAPGLTAGQVEQLVTRPVEQSVNGAAGVAAVRSESLAGLSVVTVVFAEGADPYRARQVVAEALSEIGPLPAGVAAPKVAPLTSSTMDLLKVGFTSDRLSPMQLRDVVEWTVRPRLLAARGVARATIYGGQTRRIEVRARPADLAARDLGLADVLAAAKAAAGVAGGGYIDTPQQRILVEPRGQARTAADIAASPLPAVPGAAPARIGDVADVVEAPGPLNGDALIMGRPGVLISLSSQYGANTLDATRAVEAALAELAPALRAHGIHVEAGLHRPANFIGSALRGVAQDLAIGSVLIALVLFLFLRDLRTVVIAFVSIPLALVTAVILLQAMGQTLNVMTLGGLAVALGVVVDDAVIGTENIVRRLRARPPDGSAAELIRAASVEVRAPVVHATVMLALVLLPVLLLHGLQGAFFAPLAASFIIAILASLAVAVGITPPLALLLLLQGAGLHEEPRLLVRAKDWHERRLVRVLAAPRVAVAASALALAATTAGFLLFNSELLPSFREGHFVLGVAGPAGTSLPVMRDYGRRITRDLLAIDGVQSAEQQIGRAQGGEDTWGTERSEFHVELKPGLSGRRQDEIENRIRQALDSYPGLTTEVLTFLGDRIGESLSGETAALAIGVYGGDLDTLDRIAGQVAGALETVPGATDVRVQTPPATPAVRVDLDFPALARYGVAPAEAMDAVAGAYQGATAAQVFQGDRAIDVAVTLPPEMRQDPESVGDLLVRSNTGLVAPLRSIAAVRLVDTRTSISHEGGRLRQVVTANPAPRDAARVAKAAQDAIARKVRLPVGVYLDYTGTAQAAAAARRDLLFNSAVALGGVIAVLLIAFRSGRATGLILAAAPFALVGGIIAVALTGATLSLGALVGFVTLFGIAARNAILLIAHLDHLMEVEGHAWSEATVVLATRERVTPILMTALVTSLGVLPLALSTGEAGREIQGPMAIVILGGLVTSTIASLILLPSLIWRYGRAGPAASRAPRQS